MNISNSYSPTSVTIGASYTFGATIGSKQGSGSNSNYHQPFVAERRGLKDRNRIHQADGKALSIGAHCSQRLGTVCQMMTFIKHVSKDQQFTITHREILHTSLSIPGSTVKTFLKDAVCLVNTCRFVCSFDIHIPIGMNTIIKIGNGAEVFCILGCSRSNHGRTLQITDYAFTCLLYTSDAADD